MLNSSIGAAFAGTTMFALGNMNVDVSNITWLVTVMTAFLGYILDILVAKQCFNVDGRGVALGLPGRLKWLAKSFFTYTFVRVTVLIIIDALVTQTLFAVIREKLDNASILSTKRWRKYRDIGLSAAVSMCTFWFYVNYLQFQWAYKQERDMTDDIVMLLWCFVSFVSLSLVTKQYHDHAPADNAPAEQAPAEQAPAEQAPADHGPADHAPADHAPADHAPAPPHSPADHAPANAPVPYNY